jgi:DNA-binding MarR family transcriptional regulator
MLGTSPSDLRAEQYANLALTRRLIRRYLAFSEHAAESAGLEPQHYQLLLMLRGLTPRGAAAVSDLADWLQIRHHSAVGLVDRMQARGLVERHPDPLNRRRVLVAPTRQGRAVLRSLAVLHRDELLRLAPDLVESLKHLVDGRTPDTAPALATANPF